jgi:exosortase A
MNAEQHTITQAGGPAISPTTIATLIALTLAAGLLIFWPTSASMVAIWWRSETFAHGFFILPISLYFIWQRREQLAHTPLRPDYKALAPLFALGMLWWLANAIDVLVVQQLALVAMLPVLVWVVFGWRMLRSLAFPLGFLIFAVPMGEGLIPPLMNFTAEFTVKMLQLTGIPVFKEGLFFEIPGSRWSVVEGCSGVRYLIASVTLGVLYAYVTYRSLTRRLLFVLAAIVVPIIANGLRAYMIVMISHLSDHKLAHGVDHFIYGWVFFGIVMLLLFWLGSFWREDDEARQPQIDAQSAESPGAPCVDRKSMSVAALAAFAVLIIWPAAAAINTHQDQGLDVNLSMPEAQNGWRQAPTSLTPWRPRYLGMDAELEQTYVKDGRRVSLYLAYYRTQRQGAELINSQNVMVEQKHPVWSQVGNRPAQLQVRGEQLPIRKAKLRSAQQNLVVYYWDWFGGEYAANDYVAKLLEAKNTLLGGRTDAAGVIIAAEFETEATRAEALIKEYISDMYPAVETSLYRASEPGP